MNNELTQKQEKTLNTIKKFIEKNGYSPSVREIASLTGVNSPATALFMMKTLKRKGYIDFVEGKSRTVRIL